MKFLDILSLVKELYRYSSKAEVMPSSPTFMIDYMNSVLGLNFFILFSCIIELNNWVDDSLGKSYCFMNEYASLNSLPEYNDNDIGIVV